MTMRRLRTAGLVAVMLAAAGTAGTAGAAAPAQGWPFPSPAVQIAGGWVDRTLPVPLLNAAPSHYYYVPGGVVFAEVPIYNASGTTATVQTHFEFSCVGGGTVRTPDQPITVAGDPATIKGGTVMAVAFGSAVLPATCTPGHFHHDGEVYFGLRNADGTEAGGYASFIVRQPPGPLHFPPADANGNITFYTVVDNATADQISLTRKLSDRAGVGRYFFATLDDATRYLALSGMNSGVIVRGNVPASVVAGWSAAAYFSDAAGTAAPPGYFLLDKIFGSFTSLVVYPH
jgi:hypothetical protein